MLRKWMFGLTAVAALALVAPTAALARGGFGGHGGGFLGGGFHGGGFHRGGFGGRGVGIGLGLGLAGAGLYGGYGYGAYGYGYPYAIGGYDDEGGCYLVRRRIMTPAGYRVRRVEVCE